MRTVPLTTGRALVVKGSLGIEKATMSQVVKRTVPLTTRTVLADFVCENELERVAHGPRRSGY